MTPLVTGFVVDGKDRENFARYLNALAPSAAPLLAAAARGSKWLEGQIDQYGLAYYLSSRFSGVATVGVACCLVHQGVDEGDTGTLVFVCALRHKEAYNVWDYVHAAREYVDRGVGPQSNGEAPQAGESTGSSSGESRPRPLPPSLQPLPSRRTLTRPAQTPRSARC